MHYTIKQVSEKTGLSIYTLRYYDKEGLLPLIKRSKSGIRRFSDNDISWLKLICCLKNSGMPIEQIKEFMNLCLQGNKTAETRKNIMLAHREKILEQMKQLESSLHTIDYKIDHYKEIGIFHIDASNN
ncbi:MerR family transcriptional regulator [Anaerocolumna cellulosilytica]|uniref:MerR family transcriptional regulator n=1 Tax=Anaerocolumna cellulosilytica TaxID=433286 RepID=A0A6S6R524_9FIRM|nr:MerR family transcriptional regulator [Anaerocolumna cellulosilytica]MBB5198036.1 DNA-binding transcriptional MerR regulator [Anaerocolumna cellulosilytica]BCJ95177.1 MerR family transcriptional regulator [Anaerocolumna cellulosilytica]